MKQLGMDAETSSARHPKGCPNEVMQMKSQQNLSLDTGLPSPLVLPARQPVTSKF